MTERTEKPWHERSLAELQKIPSRILGPEEPKAKRAREAREQVDRDRAERDQQARVTVLAQAEAQTPVVSPAVAEATKFPNFPAVQAILKQRAQVQDKRRKFETKLADLEVEYTKRRQGLSAENSQALILGREPNTTAVATLARIYLADRAALEAELDALREAEDGLWRSFIEEFAKQIRAFRTKQRTEFHSIRREEHQLLTQLHAVQQRRATQHHAVLSELGRIKRALGHVQLGPATRTVAGEPIRAAWRDGRGEVVVGRTPDTTERLDDRDTGTVRRFLDGDVGITSPVLVRDLPEHLLTELVRALRTETEEEASRDK